MFRVPNATIWAAVKASNCPLVQATTCMVLSARILALTKLATSLVSIATIWDVCSATALRVLRFCICCTLSAAN